MISRFILLIAPLAVFGCQVPSAQIETTTTSQSFCKEAHAMTWAVLDTSATVTEIEAFNAMGARLCGWGTPSHGK